MRAKLSPEERAARQKLHKVRWYRANKDQAKAAARRWKETHPEKVNEASKAYAARNRDVIAARKRTRKYGISLEEQEWLLAAQGNACAICQQPFLSSRSQHTDHDHVTGTVRGFLCGPCNQAIGLMKDSAKRLCAAATYLESQGCAGVRSSERNVA